MASGPETHEKRRNCSGLFTGMLFQSAASIKVKIAVVPWPDERPFLDADTPEDLARIATL